MHVTLGADDVYTLRMNVVVVRIPKRQVKGFSLRQIFGEKKICDCVLSPSSTVIIDWPYWAMHNEVTAPLTAQNKARVGCEHVFNSNVYSHQPR